MKTLLALAAAGALAGCAGMLTPMPTADQLGQMAAIKNASVVCGSITGVGGVGKFVVINMDQNVIRAGGISVSPDCTSAVTNNDPVKQTAPAVAIVRTPAGLCYLNENNSGNSSSTLVDCPPALRR